MQNKKVDFIYDFIFKILRINCIIKEVDTMRIEEHYENFISQPDVERDMELYCSILENRSDDWLQFYYGLMNEVCKDRGLFVTPDEQLKEYGQIRDLIENEISEHGKKCLITVLFDALMVEKIKTYSLNFDAPAILSDELHEEYLRQSVYDEGDNI